MKLILFFNVQEQIRSLRIITPSTKQLETFINKYTHTVLTFSYVRANVFTKY